MGKFYVNRHRSLSKTAGRQHTCTIGWSNRYKWHRECFRPVRSTKTSAGINFNPERDAGDKAIANSLLLTTMPVNRSILSTVTCSSSAFLIGIRRSSSWLKQNRQKFHISCTTSSMVGFCFGSSERHVNTTHSTNSHNSHGRETLFVLF